MHARSKSFELTPDKVDDAVAAQQIHATGSAKGEIAGDQWEVLLDDMA
jgi:hypothetical protein